MMNRFFTLFLTASCLTAVGQVPDYVPTDGLLGWWALDGNAVCEIGGIDDGLVLGPTPTENRFGIQASAFRFDGDDRVEISDQVELRPESFTVSIWAWVDASNGQTQQFVAKNAGNGPYESVDVVRRNDNSVMCNIGGPSFYGTWLYDSSNEFPPGQWNHIVYSFDDSLNHQFLYQNGVLIESGSVSESIEYDSLPWTLGTERENGVFSWWLVGRLDDFGLWDRVLSPYEVSELFNWTPLVGCIDAAACNFNADASVDDGSCYSCDIPASHCGPGTIWDAEMQMCIGDGSGDINLDGCVQLNDLLDLLSAYGNCTSCFADEDFDGVCDDIDDCVGEFDECGICNGLGAIYDCGCAGIPEGTCDCDGNQLDAVGVCGGDCASDFDADGICDDEDDCLDVNQNGICDDDDTPDPCNSDVDNDGIADCDDDCIDVNQNGICDTSEPPWSCGEDLVFKGHTYATVQINGQCWFAENLRSTSYANGDAIAGDLNDPAWSTTSSGGRATFGEGASVCYGPVPGGDACNEAFSLASYGRLYNWHAVNDARGLCPSGWHVPSDGEWTTLTDGIGGALTAGNTLKAGSGWFNNGNGTSPNGFEAFPGGQRMNAGNFQGAGTDAFFWTSTAVSSVQVWFRSMGWNLPEVVRNPAEKNVGMSVRCLKD